MGILYSVKCLSYAQVNESLRKAVLKERVLWNTIVVVEVYSYIGANNPRWSDWMTEDGKLIPPAAERVIENMIVSISLENRVEQRKERLTQLLKEV